MAGEPLPISEMSPGNPDSAIAYQFCVDHALVPYLSQTIELALSVFDVVGDVRLHRESDPEAGEEYVVIDIPVRGVRLMSKS